MKSENNYVNNIFKRYIVHIGWISAFLFTGLTFLLVPLDTYNLIVAKVNFFKYVYFIAFLSAFYGGTITAVRIARTLICPKCKTYYFGHDLKILSLPKTHCINCHHEPNR